MTYLGVQKSDSVWSVKKYDKKAGQSDGEKTEKLEIVALQPDVDIVLADSIAAQTIKNVLSDSCCLGNLSAPYVISTSKGLIDELLQGTYVYHNYDFINNNPVRDSISIKQL